MRRRDFITLVGSTAAWPLAARAQQTRIWRIGVLETISAALNSANLDAFRQGLRELGYVEGRNLSIVYRSADGDNGRFPNLAQELLQLNVDCVVTRGTPAALAAKAASTTMPIVMAAMGEPLMIVASLARPGGNATGLSSFVTELQAKRLEVLRETFPSMRRVAALLTMSNPVTPPQWLEIERAAEKLGLEARLFDVREPGDLAKAMESARTFGAAAAMIGTGALLQSHSRLLGELVALHRLPTMHVSREWVADGGLMAYGISYPDLYRRSAGYVDKIIKGTAPADLPVEQPTKFELVINMKTAKALQLEMPPTLLARADEVIE